MLEVQKWDVRPSTAPLTPVSFLRTGQFGQREIGATRLSVMRKLAGETPAFPGLSFFHT
jgi:hypothetical protein